MTTHVPDIYLQIIQKHNPHVTPQEIKAFLEGNDHFVFVMNADIVFRFPRFPQEISPIRKIFLDQFARVSPIPTPTIEIHFDKEAHIYYETHTFIPGVSFYPDVAKGFNHDNLLRIAENLGKFLTMLHSFSLRDARELGVAEMDATTFWAYMEQNEKTYPYYKASVFPSLSPYEQKWAEKLFTEYISLIKVTPFITKITHSDMWVYHIIVDPQTQTQTLSGVIDFAPRIADPARDFKAFEYYGKSFVDEVYQHYNIPVDATFEKRRLFYTAYDEIFEFARSLERKDKEKIALQKRHLSAYIRNHPL